MYLPESAPKKKSRFGFVRSPLLLFRRSSSTLRPEHEDIEQWLRSRGLGRFSERLQEFGIETVADLQDSMIVSDVELRNEIGMNQSEIDRFRSAVFENRAMDWSYLDQSKLDKIERMQQGRGLPEGYAEFALFSRKLDRIMHFERLDANGQLHNCAVTMCEANVGVSFNFGLEPIELGFGALRGVHDLVTPAGLAKFPELGSLMTLDVAKRGFVLSFSFADEAMLSERAKAAGNEHAEDEHDDEDPSTPLAPGPNLARSRWKKAIAAAKIEVAKNTEGTSDDAQAMWNMAMTEIKSKRDLTRHGVRALCLKLSRAEALPGWWALERAVVPAVKLDHLAKALTARDGGLFCLLLIADTYEDKVFAANGFKNAARNYKDHAHTNEFLHKKVGLCADKWPSWLGFLELFHHLYRPHFDFNRPPDHYHNGITCEVQFSETYEIVVVESKEKRPINKLKLPCPIFQPGMFLRATITGFDKISETYELVFKDGPYLGDEEADGSVNFKLPAGSPKADFMLVGVKQPHITVDLYDNFGSSLPVFIVVISLVQIIFFVRYVTVVEPGVAVTSTSPVAGPNTWWMKVVSDFPQCADLRSNYWRLTSYQLVHAGWQHLTFNMVMQLVFGLPLNMVHGNFRFAVLYELGVLGGSFGFSVIGGGHGALVGCSGGVYAIFGMHIAEIIINWDVQNKGIMNHWTRLVVISGFLALDVILFFMNPTETTSYEAHIGGWLVGLIMGILLLDNIELAWIERYFLFPSTYLLATILAVGLPGWFMYSFPPKPALWPVDGNPCCWQLLSCPLIERSDFHLFKCMRNYDLMGERRYMYTCDEFKKWVDRQHRNGVF